MRCLDKMDRRETEKRRTAEAVRRQSEDVCLERIERCQGMMKREGNNAKVSSFRETAEWTAKRIVLFRRYNVRLNRINVATRTEVEKLL